MNSEYIYRKIIHILNQYGIDTSSVSHQASFSKDLGLDSLDFTELTMEVEVAFEVDIPFNESEKVETVSDLILLIDRLKNEQSFVTHPE